MPIDDIAARGFGSAADAYERGRPTYPSAALAWLTEHLPLAPGATVCDLGAGTGKLTRQLCDTGATVVAAEPVAGMRAVLASECPAASVLATTAEALSIRAGTLDAVLVAQAFHWFDTGASLAEASRVLRPGGSLALIWNAWDDSVPWVAALHGVVAEAGATPQWQRGHFSRAWAGEAMAAHADLGPVTQVRVPHHQLLDRAGVVDRVATTSHIVAADTEVRDATLAAVRAILDADPATRDRDEIAFPYVTEIYASVRS
jgi:SAM-dependent methyltransferase